MPTVATALRRVRNTRTSADFNFTQRIAEEVADLKAHYGDEGEAAAELLSDAQEIGAMVDDLTLAYLIPLRTHWRKPLADTTGMRGSLRASRSSWRVVAFNVQGKHSRPGPDWSEAHDHPSLFGTSARKIMRNANALASRFLAETAMNLAEAYDAGRHQTDENRSVETDVLMRELGVGSPKFAPDSRASRYAEHMKVANAYRKYESVAEALRDGALVLLGTKALATEEHEERTNETVHLTGSNGKQVSALQVRGFIQSIGRLPAYGEWAKATDPAKVIAMARAVHGLGTTGISFTANLSAVTIGPFAMAKRETGSAIQEKLRKSLKREFGVAIDFYFVIERGVGQRPHLHGAVALDSSASNLNRVRSVLKRIVRADLKPLAPERLVDVKPLVTPGRWGAYSVKHPLLSGQTTGVQSVLRYTQRLGSQARLEWELMRAEQRDAKSVLRVST